MTMNQYSVPDWSLDEESQTLHDLLPTSNHRKNLTQDNELVELLWKNGHVVMQSQSTLKPPSTVPEAKEDQKFDTALKYGSSSGNSSNLIQEDGPLPWFQYHLDDSLEREFSDYFCEIPDADAIYANKTNKDVRFSAAEDTNAFTMPPPKFGCTQQAPSLGNSGIVNRLPSSKPTKDDLGSRSGGIGVGESSSVRTVGSSACGSNQADISYNLSNGTKGAYGIGVKEGVQMNPLHEGAQTNTFDPTVTSSSGGSGCSFGRATGQRGASTQNHKRKGRDRDDSECHSEEAEYESIDANRPAQRSVSMRKSRAAEVHNLSERRRRDRINEKMKALQELIPHCNKSDKASMLDEAIEYLKSLQLQLQIMWMGSGMAPMMFPGVQQYMSRVGIGMGHASMPSMSNPIQLPRTPLINHSMPSTSSANKMPMCPSLGINPINFPRQMQSVHLPESYAQCLGFPHMQLPPQAMNLYAYGSHMVQQNQTAAATGSSSSLLTAGIPSEKIQNGQSDGKKTWEDSLL